MARAFKGWREIFTEIVELADGLQEYLETNDQWSNGEKRMCELLLKRLGTSEVQVSEFIEKERL